MQNNYILLKLHGKHELETFLTIRYDNHGQAIDQHNPNKKRRKAGGGWTTWFVKIRKKK